MIGRVYHWFTHVHHFRPHAVTRAGPIAKGNCSYSTNDYLMHEKESGVTSVLYGCSCGKTKIVKLIGTPALEELAALLEKEFGNV